MLKEREHLYRYDVADHGHEELDIILTRFEVKSHTPKGKHIWLRSQLFRGYGKKDSKWVSNTSIKRYAYPTKEEALDALLARKHRQLEILEYQKHTAQRAVNQIRGLQGKEPIEFNPIKLDLKG